MFWFVLDLLANCVLIFYFRYRPGQFTTWTTKPPQPLVDQLATQIRSASFHPVHFPSNCHRKIGAFPIKCTLHSKIIYTLLLLLTCEYHQQTIEQLTAFGQFPHYSVSHWCRRAARESAFHRLSTHSNSTESGLWSHVTSADKVRPKNS